MPPPETQGTDTRWVCSVFRVHAAGVFGPQEQRITGKSVVFTDVKPQSEILYAWKSLETLGNVVHYGLHFAGLDMCLSLIVFVPLTLIPGAIHRNERVRC